MILGFIAGCAVRLGHPEVSYGPPVAIPVVRPSTELVRPFVEVDLGEAGTWLWFVDTGFAWSACDDDAATALGLTLGRKVTTHGVMGAMRSPTAELPPLHIGGHVVEGLVCTVRDFATTSSLEDPPEVRIGGVLGIDLLGRFGLRLGPDAQLTLVDPTDTPWPPGALPVQVRREPPPSRRVLVPVDFDGTEIRLVLDTGSTSTLVRELPVEGVVETVIVRGSGPERSEERALTRWEVDAHIGGVALGTTVVRSHDGRPLLGMDVLAGRTVVLDFGARTAWVGPREGPGGWIPWTPDRPPPMLRFAPAPVSDPPR